MNNDFITVREAARITGYSRTWINMLINAGRLQAYRRGSRKARELKRSDVLNFIEPKPITRQSIPAKPIKQGL